MSSGPQGPALGERVALSEKGLRLGQGTCEVFFEHRRWWLRNLGNSVGVFHLGVPVHDVELFHGDCFEVVTGSTFRLLLRPVEDIRHPEMEQALIEQPDDDKRWSVYADWLLERGAALGERLSNPIPQENMRWLGPLARDAARGDLEVRWAHGLPAQLVLRSLSAWHSTVPWEARLRTMLRQPQFRFVRTVTVDVGSFERGSLQVEAGKRVLEILGPSAWPLLERVAIGPGTGPADVEMLTSALEARRALHPRFTTTAQTLFVDWGEATFTLQRKGKERVIALERNTLFRAGPPSKHLKRVFRLAELVFDLELGSRSPQWSVFFAVDRWRLEVSADRQVQLNAIACTEAFLRPGDVIEPERGVSLRFEA